MRIVLVAMVSAVAPLKGVPYGVLAPLKGVPYGLRGQNFDPIGRWRTSDQAGPVDASGAFVDGSPISGVVDLRNVLLQRPDAFRTTVTEQLLAYAAGRPVKASAMTADTLVRARQILRHGGPPRWSSVVAAIAGTTRP